MSDDTNQRILEIIDSEKPDTVEDLVKIIVDKKILEKEDAKKAIILMEERDEISLRPLLPPVTFQEHIMTFQSIWFWLLILLSFTAAVSVLLINDINHPSILFRQVSNVIYLLFLPGFSFVKILYPSNQIGEVERAALSITMSLIIVPFIGFILIFTPWGISESPLNASMLFITIILSTIGVYREYLYLKNEE